MERVENKAILDRMPASTANQLFLKETLVMAADVREKVEVCVVAELLG
jgi:hypothetical protein